MSCLEFGQLMHAVGWGNGYTDDLVQRSLAAYPFIAHARLNNGDLIGYVSAFSDCAFSTMLGELVVHPHWQRHGVGRALLKAVEQRYSRVPVYVKAMCAATEFFSSCGYRRSSEPMQVMFNDNGAEG